MYDKKQVVDQLDKLFGLKPADIEKTCHVKIEDTWPAISDKLEDLQKVADNLVEEQKKTMKLDDSGFGTAIEKRCEASPEYKKARQPVVDKALPCSADARKAEAMTFAEKNSCKSH
ncbi:uncharacterized protein LOC117170206 [Belonocnema kinseyi]|uniref:uncharacterized protein LOC117170206 n=1 Tax=Belonocnema kinseyi TaxID=2817044 RepID=UPI00143D39F0|nr:uncharacterized protein LOC117170206 [Belonocnema kinseyi]